jgi:hypothetical protein
MPTGSSHLNCPFSKNADKPNRYRDLTNPYRTTRSANTTAAAATTTATTTTTTTTLHLPEKENYTFFYVPEFQSTV